MAKYHISEDGAPHICEAADGRCPLKEEDGSATPHGEFSTPQEAQRFAEKVNSQRYGDTQPMRKQAPEEEQDRVRSTILPAAAEDFERLTANFTDETGDEQWEQAYQQVLGHHFNVPKNAISFDGEGATIVKNGREIVVGSGIDTIHSMDHMFLPQAIVMGHMRHGSPELRESLNKEVMPAVSAEMEEALDVMLDHDYDSYGHMAKLVLAKHFDVDKKAVVDDGGAFLVHKGDGFITVESDLNYVTNTSKYDTGTMMESN